MFWLSLTLFRALLPGYHDRNLLGAQVDARVLSEILEQQDPECFAAFSGLGVSPDLFFVEWVLGKATSRAIMLNVVLHVGVMTTTLHLRGTAIGDAGRDTLRDTLKGSLWQCGTE